MAFERITAEQLKKEYEFEIINSNSVTMALYRYFPLNYFMEMMEKGELAFIYPALWNDPYEILYLETDYTALNYKRQKVYCLCCRNVNDNEEASWKVYSNGKEPLIRISFCVSNLFKKIKVYADKNECKVYLARISYKLKGTEIKNIQKNENLRNVFFKNFDEKKYIGLLSLKRPSFIYEKEWRIFIVPQSESLNLMDNIIKIPIDTGVFKSFTINPLDRIRKEDKANEESTKKEIKYLKEVDKIKAFLKKKAPNVRTFRSWLYYNTKPIDKIDI